MLGTKKATAAGAMNGDVGSIVGWVKNDPFTVASDR